MEIKFADKEIPNILGALKRLVIESIQETSISRMEEDKQRHEHDMMRMRMRLANGLSNDNWRGGGGRIRRRFDDDEELIDVRELEEANPLERFGRKIAKSAKMIYSLFGTAADQWEQAMIANSDFFKDLKIDHPNNENLHKLVDAMQDKAPCEKHNFVPLENLGGRTVMQCNECSIMMIVPYEISIPPQSFTSCSVCGSLSEESHPVLVSNKGLEQQFYICGDANCEIVITKRFNDSLVLIDKKLGDKDVKRAKKSEDSESETRMPINSGDAAGFPDDKTTEETTEGRAESEDKSSEGVEEGRGKSEEVADQTGQIETNESGSSMDPEEWQEDGHNSGEIVQESEEGISTDNQSGDGSTSSEPGADSGEERTSEET